MHKIMKLLLPFVFLLTSCFPSNQESINGTYYSVPENWCSKNIIIKIFTHKGQMNYEICVGNEKKEGQLNIIDDDFVYLDFGTFEGTYENDTIIVQNYGNSLNYYLRFSECDAKYLFFKKSCTFDKK